ncbi:MAG: N-acetyl-gamma-glutamyl-phosphate reductase [Ignavibacteria bacterium]|nr:N-acetyl-gamma-glutamyl-phosphate reductase [Ignavibacteria bacterium]
MISVGLIGGTGYTGKKLIQFCARHKGISEFTIYGNSTAESMLCTIFPEFEGQIHNRPVLSSQDVSLEHDVYFITLPHGGALNFVPKLISAGKKVIDLGGDYRLDSADSYKQWYGIEHTSPYLLNSKLYGLADIETDAYPMVRLISNPGCYPTSVLLGLLPLVNNHSDCILSVSTAAYSGTSGAGKSPRSDLLMTEMEGNVKAYNVNNHRHQPEILQMLEKFGLSSPFSFTTHLLPIGTGIYTTTSVHLKSALDQSDLVHEYTRFYENKPFVRIRQNPPDLKWVTNTNFCDISVSVKDKTLIITSTIDNLIKGAAGQAMQNLNLLMGWDESISLGLNRKELNYASVG